MESRAQRPVPVAVVENSGERMLLARGAPVVTQGHPLPCATAYVNSPPVAPNNANFRPRETGRMELARSSCQPTEQDTGS